MPQGVVSLGLSALFIGQGLSLDGATLSADPTSINALSGALVQTGATLISLINASAAGVSTLNGQSGGLTLVGAGTVFITTGSQSITISGSGVAGGDVTAAQLAATGQQAWTAAQNNALNISGNLALTGQQAWTAANNNALNLSGNLVATGGLLSAVKVTGSNTVNNPNFTGLGQVTIVLNGSTVTISGAAGAAGGVTQAQLDSLSGWSASAVNLYTTGATLVQLNLTTSGALAGQIAASAAGVSTLNTLSGAVVLDGAGGNLFTSISGQTIFISGSGIAQIADLVASGSLLYLRDASISGGLEARVFATGAAAVAYGNSTFATIANLFTTGETLFNRDASISGGLDARIAATGGAGVAYGNATFATIANLVATGDTLYLRDAAISGGLEARIFATGAAAVAYGDNAFATKANLASTGQQAWTAADNNGINISGRISATGVIVQGQIAALSGVAAQATHPYLYGTGVQVPLKLVGPASYTFGTSDYIVVATGLLTSFTGILPSADTHSGRVFTLVNMGTSNALISGNVGPDVNPTIAQYDSLTFYAASGTWQYIGRTGYAAYATVTSLTSASGGLEARIFATGAAGITYGNATFATIANLFTTGSTLFDRDASISGGLEARIFATGAAGITYGNATFATIANLFTTGSTLFSRDASISGGLEARIEATGAAAIAYAAMVSGGLQIQIGGSNGTSVKITGSATLTTADITGLGSVTVTRIGANTVYISGAAGGGAGDVTQAQLNSLSGYTVARSIRYIGFSTDGGGSVISTGIQSYDTVPPYYTGPIVSWNITASPSGAVSIDIYKTNSGVTPPTPAMSITNGVLPYLNSGFFQDSTGLASWTSPVTGGDRVAWVITAARTVTKVKFTLGIQT